MAKQTVGWEEYSTAVRELCAALLRLSGYLRVSKGNGI